MRSALGFKLPLRGQIRLVWSALTHSDSPVHYVPVEEGGECLRSHSGRHYTSDSIGNVMCLLCGKRLR